MEREACLAAVSLGCDGVGEFRDLSEFVGVPDDRAEVDKPAPVLPPGPLALVYAAHGTLGCDEHGRPTWAEIRAFLDELQVLDLDERRLWQRLFYAITAAEGSERARRMELEFSADRDEPSARPGGGRRR